MRHFGVLLFCLAMSGWAHAAAAAEGFHDLREISRFLSIRSASAAAPKLSAPGRSCGGAYVSRSGHYLTNLHCIKPCLLKKGVLREFRSSYPDFQVTVAENQAPGIVCEDVKVEGNSARVLFVGKGYSLFQEQYLPYYGKIELERMEEHFSDVVILKFDVKKDTPCLELQTSVSPTETLFGIGYPGSTTRSNGRNGQSSALRFTMGRKLNGLRESEFGRGLACLPGESVTPGETLDLAERLFLKDRVIVTDNDIYTGMSGGPLLNEDGAIVGVIFLAIGSTREKGARAYVHGSTLALTSSAILSEVKKVAGDAAVREYFSCRRTL